MPTVPRITQQRRPEPRAAPRREPEAPPDGGGDPRMGTYDDLILATQGLPAEERLAARWPAIMSDPASFGAGKDLRKVVLENVPKADADA